MDSGQGKLFVGGISWETNEDGLRDYFSNYGDVVEAVIMKDRITGRARGFGFVVFSDPAIAGRIVTEKHTIDGRMVEAKRAIPRDDHHLLLNRNNASARNSPDLARTKKIFVGGLPSTVTEGDFKKYFEQFGAINDAVVMYDRNTQRPRGFGFITYNSEDAVDKVLYKAFHELNGKTVEVKKAVPKELPPGSNVRLPIGYDNNYGLNCVNNFLTEYTQRYNPSSIGGYGVRMDDSLGSITSLRKVFPSLGLAYGTGVKFEHGSSPSYGGYSNYSNGDFGRYGSPIGYGGDNTRNVWGNGILNYPMTDSNAYMSTSEIGNIGEFGNRVKWGASSSTSLAQGGGSGSGNTSGRLVLGGGGENSLVFSCGNNTSFTTSSGEYEKNYSDFFGGCSVYGDSNWLSAPTELDVHAPFGYGFGSALSDPMEKGSANYNGGCI